jgi:hypothetical protein
MIHKMKKTVNQEQVEEEDLTKQAKQVLANPNKITLFVYLAFMGYDTNLVMFSGDEKKD